MKKGKPPVAKPEPTVSTLDDLRAEAMAAKTELSEYAEHLDSVCASEKRDAWTDEERTEFEAKKSAFENAKQRVEAAEEREDARSYVRDADQWAGESKPQIRQMNQPGDVIPDAEHVARPAQSNVPSFPAEVASHTVRSFTDDRGGMTKQQKAFAFGQFLRATMNDSGAKQWMADRGIRYQAVMGEGTNTAGGALVPQIFVPDLIRLVEMYGVFRRYANVKPMTTDNQIFPVRTGGLTAYAVGESDEITASDPTYINAEVTLKKWATLTRASNELLSDAAISIADQVAQEIAQAFAYTEDLCGFLGTGTSTYHGMVGVISKINDGNHAGSVYSALTGNTAFSTLDLVDFGSMVGKLPNYPGINARWYISKPAYGDSMNRLMDAAGGNTVADIAAGTPLRFMGFDVVIVQVMNSTLAAQTSTTGLVLFGDLAMSAVMGTKANIEVASDTSRYFELDQTAIRGKERFGINTHLGGITGATAGPMISLSTPGS